ncbi:MAG: CHAT domain-containing protein [Pseudomonadota bacterium]|nr:CHAT domain-containing protein [Pseudomonadota bacterium]
MTTLNVRGYVDTTAPTEPLDLGAFSDLIGCEVAPGDAVRLAAARDDRAKTIQLEATDADDVIELELSDGIRLFSTLGQLREDFPEAVTLNESTGAWRFDPEKMPVDEARGAEEFKVAALQRLKVWLREESVGDIRDRLLDDLKDSLVAEIRDNLLSGPVKWTGRLLAWWIESKLVEQPGLYRCDGTERFELRPIVGDLPEGEPMLLLIHGTGSTAMGSFGDLWSAEQIGSWAECLRRYGEQVYAFEHRTLSESPIENARDLVRRLPRGATLHLVSHSRGGLVGELLCRGQVTNRNEPFSAEEINLFAGEGHEDNLAALVELNELLRQKEIRVERFVRVACPARGTTLASKRLDRYLSVFFNLVGQVPLLKVSGAYDALSAFLLGVVKLRTNPEEIPGLEAQMPDSPLIALLNASPVELDADLSVIAGDFEGSGFFGRLKEFATNLYYWSRHDLVVNTEAMYGGGRRAGSRSRYFFDDGKVSGAEVTHFKYFSNGPTVCRLIAGLTREEHDLGGFQQFKTIEDIPKTARAARRKGPQPIVFVLPGILGSHLEVRDNRVWVDPGDLLFGGFAKLDIDASGVAAEALIGSVYHDLVEYLRDTHEVVPFPFDWRRSVREEAARLAGAIGERLDGSREEPVRIVAHSMGGLVTRALMASRPALWKRLQDRPGFRVLMLGTPNRGSFSIPGILTGQEKMLGLLSLADLKHDKAELLDLIRRFPGILEMLPDWDNQEKTGAFFKAAIWRQLRPDDEPAWPLPDTADLDSARALRRELDQGQSIDTAHMFYIAGRADATPIGIKRRADGNPVRPTTFLATRRGDGRVPWDQGIPEGVPAWFADAVHGDLPKRTVGPFEMSGVFESEDNCFEAIREILETGNTHRLPKSPPVARGEETELFDLPATHVQMYPDEAALVSAALGSRPEPPAGPRRQMRVSVAQGNLAFTRHPVMVGHYQGDTLISAEAQLDYYLDGRLSERHRLGYYPGPIGTCAVILKPPGQPGSAIVVGLGEVGKLTPNQLARSIKRALIEYAITQADCETGAEPLAVTSLLIGTAAGGLSVLHSMSAILDGVVLANESIADRGAPPGARRLSHVGSVEFLELFEDRAVEAATRLRQVAALPRFRDVLVAVPRLLQRDGGLRRVYYEEPQGWWHRMQISVQKNGELKFTVLTDRARAEIRLQATQRRLVDRYIEQAITRTAETDEITTTLFELLVPNALKEYAPDRNDLVLVVDERAARYPWELLRYRDDKKAEPLALQAGIVRQLAVSRFRERVANALENNALVVGDPPTSVFSPLIGAREEARAVADQLRKHDTQYFVAESIREPADKIVNRLYARPYRILHLAAHGVYEHELPVDSQRLEGTLAGGNWEVNLEGRVTRDAELSATVTRKVTGVVIGDDLFITPVEVEQMRQVPELVFLNCCHLGYVEGKPTIDPDRPQLAANLATQFIRMGVKVVVAAGWAVDDAAARTFAEEFYMHMLNGERFGDAVLYARQRIRRKHPGVNTWGAYQCYGDPDFTLAQPASKTWVAGSFVTPTQVVTELNNLAIEAKTADEGQLGSLEKRLEAISDSLDEEWASLGAVQSALGSAYGELGIFDQAVSHYETAREAGDGRMDLRLVEQEANLRVRWAAHLAATGENGAVQIIQGAVKQLNALTGLGKTVERYSMLAGAYKRYALITPRSPVGHLKRMCDNYRKAYELNLRRTGEIDPYPLLNWLTGVLIVERIGTAGDRTREVRETLDRFDELISTAKTTVTKQAERDTSFWNSVMAVDCDLLERLKRGGLEKKAVRESLVDAYRKTFLLASPRESGLVLEQFEAVAHLLDRSRSGKPVASALRELRKALARAPGQP